jgi:hypothetical protein
MPIVKYRAVNPHLDPRRTKLEIPGWAGNSDPRADGSHEQPWHCIPFSEYARGGIELCYPHAHEFQVTSRGSDLIFEEMVADDVPEENTPPPFRRFGEAYYTYQLLLDLKVEEGYAIKTEPHPRFFTDSTGTVPIAVPALIRHWWPMIFFVVFKVPQDGQTHIFRPGEPFMLVTIVPADDKCEPQHSHRRFAVGVLYQHGFRRHLPATCRCREIIQSKIAGGRRSPAEGKKSPFERKRITFAPWATRWAIAIATIAKVFWFFFLKKNRFLQRHIECGWITTVESWWWWWWCGVGTATTTRR